MRLPITLKRLGNFSPLRYPGGKATLAGFLEQVIKAGKFYNSVYVEPYAGGAGAALSLLFMEKVERIVINDLDPAIFAFWKTVTQEPEWFVDKIKTVTVTTDEWKQQRAIYTNREKQISKELGFALFFLNRTNRSGIVEGWPIGGIEQIGKWKIDARFNKAALIDKVERLGHYTRRIEVKNQDGIVLAREMINKGDSFIYLDPPYFSKGKSLYLNHFSKQDHASLAQLLNEFANASWILTYDNVPEIRALYNKRSITEFSLTYSAHTIRQGSEILISSDKVDRLV